MTSPKKQQRKPRPITLRMLELSAQWHLQRRALSRAELCLRLVRKCKRDSDGSVDEATWRTMIDATADKMAHYGFVDDARVLESRVALRSRRGESARKIAYVLSAQGLEKTAVQEALLSRGVDADLVAARRYVERRRLRDKDPKKALAALARQGFSFAIAQKALGPLEDE